MMMTCKMLQQQFILTNTPAAISEQTGRSTPLFKKSYEHTEADNSLAMLLIIKNESFNERIHPFSDNPPCCVAMFLH